MLILSLITAASVLLFMVVFLRIGIVAVARDAIATSQSAVATVRAPDLDDLERERAVQAAGLRLVRLSGSLIGRSALALAAAFVPVLLADWAGLAPMDAALAFMARWDVIGIVSVIMIAVYFAGRRLWQR